MFRTVCFYTLLWISLLLTIPAMIVVEIVSLISKPKAEAFAHIVSRIWGKSVIGISGSKVEIVGLENIPKEGPVLFISNHQSNFDIPVLLGYLDSSVGFLAKEEIRKIPILGRWMRYLNSVFMDRSNPRDSLKAIGRAAKTVADGHPMCVFPEGTRSGSENIGEFKAGAFKIYTKSKAAVLPVAIDGTWRMQGRDTLRVKPASVKVSVLKPVDFGEISLRDTSAISEKVKSEIQNELNRKK
ncbi:MAG: 1-acyl-sn-glycerol-3-phosphate acyltransferase [Peptostreptococcaceae bacterium]|nr:1-acyl-sn-glycerol-3-phosphate acyltransferase [Peptostreptococcaceae bacterium]